jgi:hypothetical protein
MLVNKFELSFKSHISERYSIKNEGIRGVERKLEKLLNNASGFSNLLLKRWFLRVAEFVAAVSACMFLYWNQMQGVTM